MGFDLRGVKHVQTCELGSSDLSWAYARAHSHAIDAHWTRACALNPAYFNGTVFVMASCLLDDQLFSAQFIKTDFKSFLYWRDNGLPEAGVRDAFGSGIILSSDGHIILGRQTVGHVNAGLAYPPGGFIDELDVSSNGRVDIVGSVTRELYEETGLGNGDLILEPGFYLTFIGSQISLGVAFRSEMTSSELEQRIVQHIERDSNPELSGVVVVKEPPREHDEGYAPFVLPLINAVLSRHGERDT